MERRLDNLGGQSTARGVTQQEGSGCDIRQIRDPWYREQSHPVILGSDVILRCHEFDLAG